MTELKIDSKYYLNVAKIIQLKTPRCRLPRPKMKPTVFITGWNEWLTIVQVETDV